MLRIEGLTVRLGATEILSGLDLTMGRGELFVLLGASGSGKSTLLRAIAGFAAPSAGRILLNGADIGALPPHKRPVCTVFQNYALFPHMTVLDNVAFGPRRAGMAKDRALARAREMLALVRMDDFSDRKPGALSGGQQQRVALARGLAPNPPLLLLDEPLSALDRGLRAETRDELVRLNKRTGTGFVLVTHDQEEALAMADRVGVLAEGRLAQTGTPREVYAAPASRFVAAFMGVANIFPCVVAPDGMSAEVPVLSGVVRAARPGRAGPGWVCVRAEAIGFGSAPGPNTARGVVAERAYAGETLRYGVRLADGTMLRVSRPASEGGGPDIGAEAGLAWAAGATVFLAA